MEKIELRPLIQGKRLGKRKEGAGKVDHSILKGLCTHLLCLFQL